MRFFAHRLALALGRTVAELCATMTVREFADWRAFDAESPLPDRRADLNMAVPTAALMNAQTKRKDGRPWEPRDFLLFDKRPESKPTENVGARLLKAVRSYNDARKGNQI